MIYNPGPGNRRKSWSESEWSFRSRTYDGRIISVDTIRGLAKVRIAELNEEVQVQVAGAGGLSIPRTGGTYSGTRGAWRRFMPQPDAYVAVNFTADNACRLQSYHEPRETLDEEDPTSGGQHNLGYAYFQKAALRNDFGLRPMVELRPGEWHDRSSGGAEVYGRETGTLDLVGGVARISIRKADDSVRGEAQSWDLSDGIATRVEFGVVPGPSNPTSVVPLDPEVPPVRRAFRVWLGPKTPNQPAMQESPPTPGAETPPQADPIPPVLHFRLEGGELEADEMLEGSPVRFMVSGRDPAGATETFGFRASALGDWAITGPAAFGVTQNVAGATKVNASTLDLGLAASQSAVLGDILLQLLSQLTVQTAFGPSSPPINAPAFQTFLSQTVKVQP